MVVDHETKPADITLEADKHLRGEPQAKPRPDKPFKILDVVLDDIRTVFDALLPRGQREPADVDGYIGDPEGTQINSDVLVNGIKPGLAQEFQGQGRQRLVGIERPGSD